MSRTITKAGSRLDVGRLRDHNEDDLGCRQASSDEEAQIFGELFVLADGMGGHLGGEVASRLAIETILTTYYASSQADIAAGLAQAILLANRLIYTRSSGDRDLSGMGTTCVCSVVHGDKLYIAHVGDSRAYLLRDRSMEQITEDHSWVEEQVRYGLLTPEEARVHPMRNVITRALGNAPDVAVDQSIHPILAGDILLICSDGLTTALDDEAIKEVLISRPQPQAAVDKLVEMANDAGGPDNIGIIVVYVEKVVPYGSNGESDPSEQRPKKGWTKFLPFS